MMSRVLCWFLLVQAAIINRVIASPAADAVASPSEIDKLSNSSPVDYFTDFVVIGVAKFLDSKEKKSLRSTNRQLAKSVTDGVVERFSVPIEAVIANQGRSPVSAFASGKCHLVISINYLSIAYFNWELNPETLRSYNSVQFKEMERSNYDGNSRNDPILFDEMIEPMLQNIIRKYRLPVTSFDVRQQVVLDSIAPFAEHINDVNIRGANLRIPETIKRKTQLIMGMEDFNHQEVAPALEQVHRIKRIEIPDLNIFNQWIAFADKTDEIALGFEISVQGHERLLEAKTRFGFKICLINFWSHPSIDLDMSYVDSFELREIEMIHINSFAPTGILPRLHFLNSVHLHDCRIDLSLQQCIDMLPQISSRANVTDLHLTLRGDLNLTELHLSENVPVFLRNIKDLQIELDYFNLLPQSTDLSTLYDIFPNLEKLQITARDRGLTCTLPTSSEKVLHQLSFTASDLQAPVRLKAKRVVIERFHPLITFGEEMEELIVKEMIEPELLEEFISILPPTLRVLQIESGDHPIPQAFLDIFEERGTSVVFTDLD